MRVPKSGDHKQKGRMLVESSPSNPSQSSNHSNSSIMICRGGRHLYKSLCLNLQLMKLDSSPFHQHFPFCLGPQIRVLSSHKPHFGGPLHVYPGGRIHFVGQRRINVQRVTPTKNQTELCQVPLGCVCVLLPVAESINTT